MREKQIRPLVRAELDHVDLRGHGVELDLDAAGGFIDQVDGFIGQEAVGDVTVAQLGGGDNRRVGDVQRIVAAATAPEAANNAAAQSSFIPLLTLGLPSNAVVALLFAVSNEVVASRSVASTTASNDSPGR